MSIRAKVWRGFDSKSDMETRLFRSDTDGLLEHRWRRFRRTWTRIALGVSAALSAVACGDDGTTTPKTGPDPNATSGAGGAAGGASGAGGRVGESPAGAGVVSCTINQVQSGDPPLTSVYCQEVDVARIAGGFPQFSAKCSGSTTQGEVVTMKRFFEGLCSRENAVGGCRLSPSATTTFWYYVNTAPGNRTSADVRAECENAQGIFIAP